VVKQWQFYTVALMNGRFGWRWRELSEDGSIMQESGHHFSTLREVLGNARGHGYSGDMPR
jgi:hypothetical protein